jgi:hypothetical protein
MIKSVYGRDLFLPLVLLLLSLLLLLLLTAGDDA